MKILKAFRFKLRLDNAQRATISRFSGCARFAYNKALALQMETYDKGLKKLSYPALAKELVSWKKGEEFSFLKEAPSQILQQKLMDLDKAYRNFFQKRAGFPKFRKKGIHDSFRFPEPKHIRIEGDRVCLPKIGWIRYRKSQKIEGNLKNATISLEGKDWYISFQTEMEIADPMHLSNEMVGIDMGITNFATLSTGEKIAPLNSFKQYAKKLAKAQKSLARKKKGSHNRQKQRERVALIHQKISNCRRDFLHKLSTTISQNHRVVVLEELKVKNMSRSSAGTLENPGKQVKAKGGLNRSILDQGWGEFKRQLIYKQLWRGGEVRFINPQHTSQRCSACGHTERNNRLTQEKFVCQDCGYTHNADINAAKNILAAGHAVIACGEIVRPKETVKVLPKAVSVKQEPTHQMKASA